MHPTRRFSDRVNDYVKYRPGYPDAVFDAIDRRAAQHGSLPRVAADMGSGTGIFSKSLLTHGWRVHAIEPNQEMRTAAESMLDGETGFISHATQAESTALPDASIALVTAAQAFHWFDPDKCRAEWRRALMPGGLVCLVWNVRHLGSSFMHAYEALLSDRLPEYQRVTCRQAEETELLRFFNGACETEIFANEQVFDWTGLVGRVMSSSYVPKADHPSHKPLMVALRKLFDEHALNGQVHFLYETRATFGHL